MLNKHTAETVNLDAIMSALEECSLEEAAHLATNALELSRVVIQRLLLLDQEQQTGSYYSHERPHDNRYQRYGVNPGSVKIQSQRIPIEVPRTKDRYTGRTHSPEVYRTLRSSEERSDKVVNALLKGMSTRNYHEAAHSTVDAFGLSKSTLSKEFIEASAEIYQHYQERRLDDDTYVAMYIDGKTLMGQQMIHAVGVTAQGYKRSLGLTEGNTENSRVISVMLRDMIKRGLAFEDGILFCLDGGTGLHKAVEDVFGIYAVIQRCEFHKHQNVESHLNEEHKLRWRANLSQLFDIENHTEAEARANELIAELTQVSQPAARSLREGLDEILTLQRLGIKHQLGRAFSTTNAIESINSVIARETRKITRWTTNDQRLRWAATILVQHEHKMNRVPNYRKLSMLQLALKNEIQQREFNLHQ